MRVSNDQSPQNRPHPSCPAPQIRCGLWLSASLHSAEKSPSTSWRWNLKNAPRPKSLFTAQKDATRFTHFLPSAVKFTSWKHRKLNDVFLLTAAQIWSPPGLFFLSFSWLCHLRLWPQSASWAASGHLTGDFHCAGGEGRKWSGSLEPLNRLTPHPAPGKAESLSTGTIRAAAIVRRAGGVSLARARGCREGEEAGGHDVELLSSHWASCFHVVCGQKYRCGKSTRTQRERERWWNSRFMSHELAKKGNPWCHKPHRFSTLNAQVKSLFPKRGGRSLKKENLQPLAPLFTAVNKSKSYNPFSLEVTMFSKSESTEIISSFRVRIGLVLLTPRA